MNTLYLIILISIEDFDFASILLIGFFLCLCSGVYENMNNPGTETGNTEICAGFVGMMIMFTYYYKHYNLGDPTTFYQWVIYFNYKSVLGF